jgi:hypothetical protein
VLNCPPGPIDGELHAPLLAVEVCAVLSLLIHVTVVPTVTLSGFGEYAVVVIVDAPLTIETEVPDVPDPDPEVAVPVEGADGESELHADKRPKRTTAQPIRKLMLTS